MSRLKVLSTIARDSSRLLRLGDAQARLALGTLAFTGLWLSASLSRFGYRTAGVRLRFGELIGLVILAAVLLIMIRSGRRADRWLAALIPFVYVGAETLSTLLNPADWGRGFKLDVLLGVEAALAFAAAYLAGRIDGRAVARTIVGVGTVAAGIAVSLTILNGLRLTSFGVQTDPVTGLCKTYGTMFEANLLASYLAAVLVFSLAVPQLLGPTWVRGAIWGVLAVAIGFTWTRAAWLATLIGVATLLILQLRVTPRIPNVYLLAGLGIAALAALAAGIVLLETRNGICGVPHIAPVVSTQGSIEGRAGIIVLAIREWVHSPWWGLGTGSFGSPLPGDPNQPWIPFMALAILHDTGLIGSIIAAGLIGWLLLALVRWRPSSEPQRAVGRGLTAAILTILLAFQATTGVVMEFPWIFAGTAIGVLNAPRSALV